MDIGIDRVEENFSTREPQFYKRLFQINIEGQYGITYPILYAPIVNVKETVELEYDFQGTLVVYHQDNSNSCCFSSLAYASTASGQEKYTRATEMQI